MHNRSRTYEFEEFLLSWGDKLKTSGEPNGITLRLQRDVDRFHVSEPVPLRSEEPNRTLASVSCSTTSGS